MVQTHQESLTIKLLPLANPLPPPSPQCMVSAHPLAYKALPVQEQREGGERGRDKANRGVRLQRGKYLSKKSSVLRKFIPCAKICSMCLHTRTHAHFLTLSDISSEYYTHCHTYTGESSAGNSVCIAVDINMG